MKANLLFSLAPPTPGRWLYSDGYGLSYARRVFSLLGLLLLLNQTASRAQCFQNILDLKAYRLYPVGSKPYALAKGDLNGDGKADLVTASIVDNTVSVLLGDGAGGFAPATGFAVGSNPYSVAIGDFNGDGKADLVAANYYDNAVTVLLGTGTGSFGSPISFAVGSNPISVAVGDVNRDGNPDLVTANDGGGSVSVLLGNGTGGFAPATGFSVGNSPRSVVVADLNGDSNPDLVTANTGSDNVSVLLGDGAGGFGNRADFVVGSTPQSVTVGNLNGDGNADLVVANAGNTVSVLLGNGLGSFGVKTDFAVGGGPSSVAIGEFNGDGKPDLVTANVFDNTVSVLLGDGAGGFAKSTDFKVRGGPNSVVVGDFDGDGNADLATVLLDDNMVLVQRGDGAVHFAIKAIFEVPGGPYAVAVGDFNGDGKPDLATANLLNSTVSVLLATGTGSYATFTTPTSFMVGGSPNLTVGDVNGDGNADLALPNANSTVSVLLGDGTGRFGNRADFAVARDPSSVAIGDFNGDGKPDLVTANSSNDNVSVLLGNGQGSFGNRADFAVGRNPYSVAIGDFNRDGNPDLVTANFTVSTVSVLLGDGAGGFGNKADFTVGLVPYSVAVADFNGDGKADLVAANSNSSTVSVLLGDGAGGFGNKADFAVNGSQRVAVGDFNGDSKLDLVTSDGVTKVTVLLGDGAGGFGNRADFAVGGPVSENYSVAVADFNGDGKPDLVTANFYDNVADVSNNTVSVLYNCTDFPLLLATSASPNPVCAGASLALSTTVTGGSAPYSFTWAAPAGITLSSTSTSAVTASVGAGVSGVQTFTLTAAASGGTPTSTSLVSVTVSAAPTNPSLSSGTLTCAQTSVTLTASATGGTSFTLNGGGESQTNATGKFVVSSPGNYTAIIANANGCTAMATSRVVSNTAALTASLTNNGPLTCAQTSVTLTASGGTSYTFTEGETVRGTPGPANTLVVSSPGTYSVRVANASGCVSTTSTTVGSATAVVVATLTANSSATLSCSQTQATLSASGGDRYVFSGPGIVSQEGSQALVNAAGVYSVTVTNTATGCFSMTSITIYQDNSAPTATLVSSGTLSCAVTSVTLTATPGGQTGATLAYRFSAGASQLGSGNQATVSSPGLYSVTVINGSNGCTGVASVSVSQNTTVPVATLSASPSTTLSCAVTSLTLTAGGGTMYAFSGPGVVRQTGNTAIVNASGTYSVTVTNPVTGCFSTTSITVTSTSDAPSVSISASATALTCTSPTVSLTAVGTGSVRWEDNSTAPVRSVSKAGTYSVTLTAPGGCTATASVSLPGDLAPPINASLSSGTLSCSQTSLTLTASATGGVSYRFSGGTPLGVDQVVVTTAGVYSVTITGANGCTTVAQATVSGSVEEPLSFVRQPASASSVAVGASVTTTVSVSGSGPLTYQWYKDNLTNPVPNQTSATLSLTNVQLTDAGSYSVVVTGSCGIGTPTGLTSTAFTLAVTAPNPLLVTLTADPLTLVAGGATSLSATVSGGTQPYAYQFSGPGVISPAGATARVTDLPVGVQSFTVVVSDAASPVSLTSSATVSVTVSAANTAPTVANAVNSQTATVGQSYSISLATTFTDQETPSSLTLSASGLPAGLSLAGTTLSGTPSLSGVSTVTLTATDPDGLSATTSFVLTVLPPTGTPPPTAPFAITSVSTISCTPVGDRINISFAPQYAGTTGQPIRFSVVNELSATTAPGPYSLGLYADNPVITLSAVQSGVTTSFVYNWLAACNTPNPGSNTPPTVANAVSSQTATVGQSFVLSLATTFTDQETPSSLTLSASGLPAGLSLAGTTLSGTPSVSGVSTVTLTATDPDGLSVSTSFVLTVLPPTGTPPPTAPFAITSVSTISCTPVGNRINISFAPQYSGTTGQPIRFSVVNELSATTNVGPYTLSLYADNPAITLSAVQAGSGAEARFVYNWLAACNNPNPGGNTAPTLANAISSQTATVGQNFGLNLAGTFTDQETPNQLILSATGLPTGLNLVGTTISGTASVSGVSTVTITATDPGSLSASTSFQLTVSPASSTTVSPPTGTFRITGATAVSCEVVRADLRKVTFTPQYTGVSGEPVSFSVVNELLPTTAPGPYSLNLYTDNSTITLSARQGSATTTYAYNWLASCTSGARRASAEAGSGLQVRVLGNPVPGSTLKLEVRGAEGQPLRLSLIDERGRIVGERVVEQAGAIEHQTISLDSQPSGVFLVQVSTATQRQTVKVVKP